MEPRLLRVRSNNLATLAVALTYYGGVMAEAPSHPSRVREVY